MARKDAIEVEGTVIELPPNMMFCVDSSGDPRLLAHVSGKMRLHSFGSCQEAKLC
jgi:translation initiation factor IF-1